MGLTGDHILSLALGPEARDADDELMPPIPETREALLAREETDVGAPSLCGLVCVRSL